MRLIALGLVLFGVQLTPQSLPQSPQTNVSAPSAANHDGILTGGSLRLGPGDVIQIHAVEAEEMSDKPIRVLADGYLNLPTVGRIKAADRTPEELQAEIVIRLKRLIVNPDVSVSVVETHSHPISVLGAVKNPGVFELQGRKTLLEVLSLAGGPRDDAGYIARITRQIEFGTLPLTKATLDSSGEFSVAEVPLQKVMDARDPGGNIVMMPNDVVSVPKAQMVYVIGDVLKPGAIAMGDQNGVTVLQAIAIVSGMNKTAKSTEGKILRVTPGSTLRTEFVVDLKAMLAGKYGDVPLQPEDILYVPSSLKKDFAFRTLEALGGTGITSMIYRVP